MRKVYLNLTLLIIGLAALIGGGNLIPSLIADTRAVDIGVDLSACYVIEVNPQQITSVTYNTNSQSGVRMQYGDLDATRRIYYVSASDEPTSVTINPLIEPGTGYGIRSITDASGKTYSSAPRRSIIKTSDLTVGNMINVNTELLSNITTGKLIINYHNPEGLSTDNVIVTAPVGSHYNINYKFSDFKNNSIEIPYDPETETLWYFQNSQKMFVARLDGTKKITRTMVLMSSGSTGQNYAFSADLKDNPQGTHILDVYASVIPMDVPMRFEFENSTGNEKNPDYLSGMIESITINGTTLTDKSWLEPGFTVPNGAKLTVGIKKQVRNIWEFEKAWFNGTSLFSSSSSCDIETDNANDEQVYKIRGMYNSPWRYTLNMTNPERTKLEVNGIQAILPEGASTYEGKAGYTSPALKPMGKNSTSEENPLAVYEVVVDGKTIPLDEEGCYYPKDMDEVITVTPREYKREMPIQLYCNLGYYSQYTITLDPRGQTKKIVPLSQGWQTIMVNPKDLPFATYSDDAAIYLNGSMSPLTEQEGYGVFSDLKNLTANSKVKLYTSTPRIWSISLAVENGLSCTIYADDEQIAPGEHSFLHGTEIKFIPTQKTGLVLERIDGTYIQPESDGSFKVEADSYGTYTLHKENAKILISCPSEKNIYVQNPVTGEKKLLKGRVNEEYIFHYDGTPNQTYTLKFFDPSGNFRVSNIAATPSAGFSFDRAGAIATGIKDGMSLSLEISEYVRPYSYDIWVSPGNNNNEGDESELSVVYMENGEEMLEKLMYGDNKKELSADNFPIKVGPYKEEIRLGEYTGGDEAPQIIREIIYDDSYYSSQNGFIAGIEHTFNSWDQEGVIIEEPTAIEGRIYDQYETKDYLYIENSRGLQFSYSINDTEFKDYIPPSYFGGEVTVDVYPNSKFKVHIDPNTEHFDIMELVFIDHRADETQKIPFDDSGNAEINFPKLNEGFHEYPSGSKYEGYELYIDMAMLIVDFIDDDNTARNLEIEAGGNEVQFDLLECTYEFIPVDEIVIENTLTISNDNVLQRIVGVYDIATGEDLNFDKETGRVTGLLKYANEDNRIHLGLRLETYEQPLTLTIYEDNINYNGSNSYVLAPGRPLMSRGSLQKGAATVVNFNREDMPMIISVYSLVSYGLGKRNYTYPFIYLNGELYSSSKTLTNDTDDPYLPYNIADGSVVRIMNVKNTGNVTYQIEEGIDVDIFHDVQKVGDTSVSHTLAKETIIRILPLEGDESSEYIVYRNGEKISNAEAAQGFAVTNAQETVSINKPRNIITFKAGGTTDLSKLDIVDNKGTVYTISSDNNVLELPPSIESLTILSSEEGRYISEVSAEPATMKYDLNTGLLTELSTGTLTVTDKEIEREQEVNIYVDGGRMDGAEITLGSGKQIETGQSLSSGSQSIQFSEEDLPIILRLPDSYLGDGGTVPADPTQLPTVMVNGEVLSYSAEHNGYVFPVEAFTDPSNPPVIKIYPAVPVPSEVTFLVEPGVTFSAIPDGENSKSITEAGIVELLPGTNVAITAKSVKDNEEIFIVADGETVVEGPEITYTFQVKSDGQTVEIKRKKVAVTINSDDAWRYVHVSGGGFNYPLYDESSELEFPVGTTRLTLRSISDTQRVVKVINAVTGDELSFDAETGVLSGVTDNMKISLETGDLTRDNELTIYVQENEDVPHTTLMIAEGKAVEKEIWLQSGYQKMMFGNEDLPMSIKCSVPLKVYLNNSLLDYDETDGYLFPDEIPANSVVKVFMSEQPVIKVKYNIEGPAFDVEVKHDHAGVIDTSIEHKVLPGTEITFSVDPKTLQARLRAAREAGTPELVNGNTEVTVNGEALSPGEDGIYTYKVTPDHVAEGLSFVVKRPDYIDPETGCVYSADRTTLISVSPDSEGKITLLPGVTTIAEGAFKDCSKVTSVELPESLETIEKDAFSGCTGLTVIVVPNNVTTIGEGAFNGCGNLKTVILGSSVESVADDAFSGCTNLTKSAYPESLGESPFPSEVPAVAYTVKNPVVDENGYIYAREEESKTLIFVPSTVTGTVYVPEDVTSIGADAFIGCTGMTTVVVSDNVKEVEAGAFKGCTALETVVIGAGVETIDATAFENCEKITEAVYPAAIKEQVSESFPENALNIPYTASSIEVGEDGVITGKPAEGSEGKVLVYVPAEVITEDGTYTIPEDITEIGNSAFTGCDNLTEISIPDNVEKIGEGAFSNCENLANIELGNGLKEIGSDAFSGTPITQIVIPNSVTEIGGGAFSGCDSLETVVIGAGVETIDATAFENCEKITEAVYPAAIKEQVSESFPENALNIPYTASSIEVGEDGVITGKPAEGSEGKVLVYVPAEVITEDGTYAIPEDITEIGNSAFTGCDNLTEISIPDNVEKIGEGAFSGCDKLTDIELGNGVTEIGGNAFSGTSITSITIPDSVTTIGDGAFSDCANLTELVIPDTVEDLGEGVMSGCENLSKVTIPEGVEEIGADEFKGCTSLTEVTIPESVTTIGAGAFEGCTNLENVNIPENVTSIGENAFSGCESLTSVTLPETVTEIGAGAFDGCTHLENVNIPENVTSIGDNAFKGCESLAEITIPDGVTDIGTGAFNGCSSLQTIEIPQNVTTIGDDAFRGCESLTTIAIPPTVETLGTDAFAGCTNLDKCVYPDTFNEPFGAGVGISYPVEYAVITDEGVIVSPEAVYFVPSDVTEVRIPETVSEIMPKAFKDCTELPSIELPCGLTTIGEESFSGCTSLTEIEVPNMVTSIENGAFSGCTSLSEVSLGSAVSSIGESAFSGCGSLQIIDIHSNVESIGASAFKDCGLTALHIGAGITRIGADAFAGNHLSEIAITAQTAPVLGENALGENTDAKLYVQGSAAAESYRSTIGWNIYAPEEMVVATDMVTTDAREYNFKDGDVIQLHATLQPSDAKLGAIFWESSNPAIATVDNTGKVTMGSNGVSTFVEHDDNMATITARTMYANGPVLNFNIKDVQTTLTEITDEELRAGALERLIGIADIYTVSGIKISSETKRLEPGVYVVKYQGKTFKVEVN